MRNLNSKLVMDFISEQGYDSVEKTYVAYTPLDHYMCIAVAESYDNETEENSARIAVEAVLTAFEKKPSFKRLKEYIRYANEQIFLHSTRSELKVSLTVLVSDYTRMRYAYCGNTRIYILYENIFTHISKTQTKYHQILEENAQVLPDSTQVHNLTEYLGKEKHVSPFLSKTMELAEGSTILFATSNLWGRLSEIEILDAYEYTKTGREFLEILQELLLSLQEEYDQRMGSFTAAILYIEKTYKEDIQKKKKRKKLLMFAVVATIVLLLLMFLIVSCIRALDRSQMREIEKHDQRGRRYMEYENYVKALEEYEQAVTLADGMNDKNWQYVEQKRELAEKVSDREAMLILHQEAEAAFLSGEYEKAGKLYAQIQKEATYQQFASLADSAAQKQEEVVARMQILQHISLGDMYESTQDDEQALLHYNRALNELSRIIDLELQGDVQAKIFAIRQKQREAAQAEEDAKQAEKQAKKEEKEAKEEAKKEAAKQKEEEEAAQKEAAADRAVIKIHTLLVSANSALDEGRTERARELYQQALSRYNKFTGSSEDADKLFQELTALGQAITEAEAKAKEAAIEERTAQAAQYAIQAKEAVRSGDRTAARALYEKALAIYQELNIWDERIEAVYDAIDELEHGTAQNQDSKSSQDESTAAESHTGGT